MIKIIRIIIDKNWAIHLFRCFLIIVCHAEARHGISYLKGFENVPSTQNFLLKSHVTLTKYIKAIRIINFISENYYSHLQWL